MTTKTKILHAIRKHCLICCDGSPSAVEKCSAFIPPNTKHKCLLYDYRFGTDPNPSKAKVDLGKKLGNEFGFKKN